MKLTETQIKLIAPLQKAYNEAQQELTKALFLVSGRTFTSYKIENGELIILDEVKEDKEITKP